MGGRLRGGDVIDPAVGFSEIARLGQPLRAGDPLAIVHAANDDDAEVAARSLREAFSIGEKPIEPPALIHERVK